MFPGYLREGLRTNCLMDEMKQIQLQQGGFFSAVFSDLRNVAHLPFLRPDQNVFARSRMP